ncbi:MAG: extracellular solute-binding protein [Rhodovibrionaceae bacterium]
MPVFADAEEAFQKLQAGFVADVIHPCSGDTPRWKEAGLIQAIDTSKLSNFPDINPALLKIGGTQFDGEQYFMPWEWGQTSITYRTDLVEVPPEGESWSMLWNPDYAGKIHMMAAAEDAWWCAAIYAGIDVTKTNDDGLITVTEAEIQRVRKLLTDQRDLVRLYSSDMTTIEQALASGELVAAMTWNESPLALQGEGIPVKFADPKEGALTWCCGLVLHSEAPALEKALALMDAMVSPEVGQYCIEEFGYGHSNVKAFELVAEEDLTARGLTKNPMETIAKGHFVNAVDPTVQTAINRDWEEIIAGF